MPPVSESQRRAMFAAKAGKSTLGIPQSVGAEFVKADKGGKLPQRKEEGGPVDDSKTATPYGDPSDKSYGGHPGVLPSIVKGARSTYDWFTGGSKPMDKIPQTKGEGTKPAEYAKGGPVIATRSRFLKTPDVFRTDTETTDYGKSGKGGELSKTEGDTKSQKAVKPRT
jgi:hypothetical protein